jgi:5-hydroxyisourate hydrolase
MTGQVTSHVLDLSRACPARGMKVQLRRLVGEEVFDVLADVETNADGRVGSLLLEGELLKIGFYELQFFVGDYFRKLAGANGPALVGDVFFDVVPVRFRVADPEVHYHVPLLVAPGGYSTYRGS